MAKVKGGKTYRLAEIPPGPIHASTPLSCIKISYASKAAADAARVGWRQGASYRCHICGAWHTTRNPQYKQTV